MKKNPTTTKNSKNKPLSPKPTAPVMPLMDDSLYQLQAELCAALAHPIRLKILDLISHQELSNSDLLERLQIPKPNLTQHLNVLKDAGLINARKMGLYQFCSLGMPQIKSACQMIRQILGSRLEAVKHQHIALTSALLEDY